MQAEYTELAEKLSEYAVKLLEHVRTGQELDQILNESESRNIGTDQLRRLKLAMKYDQKKVNGVKYIGTYTTTKPCLTVKL